MGTELLYHFAISCNSHCSSTFSMQICVHNSMDHACQGGGRTWKMYQHSLFLFCGFGWPPPLPLPLLLYKVCFYKFQCFFECFFVIWSWLLENPVAIASTYLPINSQTFKSQSKMLCMQVFAWRNICEKLLKAVSFTSIYITFNIIVGIGVAKVLALHDRNFRQSIHFPMVADANRGFCTATGTTKCTLPLHPYSLTQTLLDLDFWIQRGSNL